MSQTHKNARSESDDRSRSAVSSGQAAEYCLVSPGTIVNWIADGKIEAQRTLGGQFRIRISDLRSFMKSHGMRTDQLDGDFGLHPFCWEFWSRVTTDMTSCKRGPTCDDCPVHRSHATICHEVRPLLPGGTVRAPACSDCLFFSTVTETEVHD